MSPRLKVSDSIVERLSKLEKESSGFLLGTYFNSLTYILGITKQLESSDEIENDSSSFSFPVSNLPVNISYVGVFIIQDDKDKDDKDIINELCSNIEHPVVIKFDVTSKKLFTFMYEEGALKKVDFDLFKTSESPLLHLRLTATIPLSCDLQSKTLKEAFNVIEEKITKGYSAFHILNSDVYILGDQSADISGISNTSLDKVYSTLSTDSKSDSKINVLNFGLYLRGSNNDKSPQLAPLIKYVKKIYKNVNIPLSLDFLAVASTQLKLNELYSILVEGALKSLILNKKCLISQLETSDNKNISLPETYHFLPPLCDHFLTIVYPAKQTPDQLKKVRESFHLTFCLPMDRPLFRRGCAFNFSQKEDTTSSNLLLNPHETLSGSGVPDGEPCLVQGTYAYHHYMQDNIDDNGWGCAYRSLQTICSWFRFQGYTNLPVPSHKEIQQCLVNIGDKPSSFVGSKQWIGSTEVSFVLDTLLGVTCRIVNVSSGEEMSMKGGELSYHFKTQGTPIMIGGGVLAHTILGVDYNKNTGAIKFLILDPHYTGSEDLKIIQSKGWCGWKGPEFWKKDSFYNMCLPLKPKCV